MGTGGVGPVGVGTGGVAGGVVVGVRTGGGWVHPKGSNSMAMSGLSDEEPLAGAG